MSDLLTKAWRIDRRGERIYIDAPGEVCIDLCSGTPEDRARVMALLEQVQRMAQQLTICADSPHLSEAFKDEMRAVLRAAGVLDE